MLQEDINELLDKPALASQHALIVIELLLYKNFAKLFSAETNEALLKEFTTVTQKYLTDQNCRLYHLERDRFAILYHDYKEQAQVIDLIFGLTETFKKPLEIGSYLLALDLRFGLRLLRSGERIKTAELIRQAQTALEKSLAFQTVSYSIYDDNLEDFVTREQVMDKDLRQALDNNEFMLFLQPQYDYDKKMVVGFEALIRWKNPKYFLQSPAHFIELAEQNNLIVEIGRFVMEETFKMAKQLEKYRVRISMNVSPLQVIQAGFVSEFLESYKKYGLKTGAISIEITENFLMENFGAVLEKLKILKEQGIGLHLDDFGTGYSSMLYLRELPFDTIKIDRGFIKHLNTDRFSRAIVSKIIALAKGLEMEVIAEGVEDEKQNQFLLKSGCSVVQGYFFSKPLPFNEVIILLEEDRAKKKQAGAEDRKKWGFDKWFF